MNDTTEHRTSVEAGGGVLSLKGGPDNRDRASLYVGLQFDGFHHYSNLTAAVPEVKFQFFHLPTFDTQTDVIVYNPQSFNDIDIKVRLFSQ